MNGYLSKMRSPFDSGHSRYAQGERRSASRYGRSTLSTQSHIYATPMLTLSIWQWW